MKVVTMEPNEAKKKRVQKTLTTIFETLVEDHGMEPDEVGSLMVEAGNAVAEKDGSVYLYVMMQEIEKKIGRSVFEAEHGL
jgi:hypothetical protein